MFDKREEENLEVLKESTKPKTQGADVLITEDKKQVTKSYSSAGTDDSGEQFVAESYVSLLKKKFA